MLRDLHVPFPPSPSDLVIVPTSRDVDGLALSSRNAYLTPDQRKLAPTLSRALQAAADVFGDGRRAIAPRTMLDAAREVVEGVARSGAPASNAASDALRLDYLALNDPRDLSDLAALDAIEPGRGAILSGAMICGKTRLIDNIVLGYDLDADRPL